MPASDPSAYRSYLLRLWRHSPQDAWRASLQNVSTGQTYHFARAEELWAFLQAVMANECSQETGPAEPDPAEAPSSRTGDS